MKRGMLKLLLSVFLLAFLFSFLPSAQASYLTPSGFTELVYLSAFTDTFQSVQKETYDSDGNPAPNTEGLNAALNICRYLFFQHFGTEEGAIAENFGAENNETRTFYYPAFAGDNYT